MSDAHNQDQVQEFKCRGNPNQYCICVRPGTADEATTAQEAVPESTTGPRTAATTSHAADEIEEARTPPSATTAQTVVTDESHAIATTSHAFDETATTNSAADEIEEARTPPSATTAQVVPESTTGPRTAATTASPLQAQSPVVPDESTTDSPSTPVLVAATLFSPTTSSAASTTSTTSTSLTARNNTAPASTSREAPGLTILEKVLGLSLVFLVFQAGRVIFDRWTFLNYLLPDFVAEAIQQRREMNINNDNQGLNNEGEAEGQGDQHAEVVAEQQVEPLSP